jgi:ComF family protein
VPLFSPKERERGYDQAALLAGWMVRHLAQLRPEWQLSIQRGVLQRVRETRSQFGLAPQKRRANLRGAFRVRDAVAIAGREVLLVDDILTTGATARECSRVLRGAGAAKVWVATVARAQRHDLVAAWDASGEARTAAESARNKRVCIATKH